METRACKVRRGGGGGGGGEACDGAVVLGSVHPDDADAPSEGGAGGAGDGPQSHARTAAALHAARDRITTGDIGLGQAAPDALLGPLLGRLSELFKAGLCRLTPG